MSKKTPTKKIENTLHGDDNKLFAVKGDVTAIARFVEGQHEYTYDDQNGEYTVTHTPDHYTVSYHNGAMPPFETDIFESIEALANAMRDYADLRTWKTLYDADGSERI